MHDIYLISDDRLFAHMLTLELSALHCGVRLLPDLTLSELEEASAKNNCRLLILDLDIAYQGLEKMLAHAEEEHIPVILFGYPDSDAMTADKLRFYDSDIYRYVFQRPFLMNQFLYCVRELIQYKDEELLRQEEKPAMKMKEHCPADDIRINEDAHQVFYKDDLITLTYTEYETLLYLMKQRGVVVTRTQLYDAVRTQKASSQDTQKKDSNVVDVYIRYLRAKLDDHYHIRLIETVRGVGYTIRKQ